MPNKTIRNKNHKLIAQKLRAEQTEEERKLWYCFLRYLPVKVLRQQTIGNYIVDFYCASAKLVIELDGIQHYSEDGQIKDYERDRFLNDLGITVARYTNLEIQRQFDSVCMDIKRRLNIE